MEPLNETIQDRIVRIAKSYEGQEEIRENQGFKDPVFDAKMRKIGFQNGWAWCALFAKLIWMEAYAPYPELLSQIIHNCSPSALGTLHNWLQNSGDFVFSKEPAIGAICIWQEGNTGFSGHAAICIGLMTEVNYFSTMEGNTNTDGSREGYESAEKKRLLSFTNDPNKLNLKGFILPAPIPA